MIHYAISALYYDWPFILDLQFYMQWTLRGLCIGELCVFIVKFYELQIMNVSSFFQHILCLDIDVSGFIVFLGVIWILQETTKVRILRYIILFIGKYSNNLFFWILFGVSIEILLGKGVCLKRIPIQFLTQVKDEVYFDHFDWKHNLFSLKCRSDEQLVFSIRYVFWKS